MLWRFLCSALNPCKDGMELGPARHRLSWPSYLRPRVKVPTLLPLTEADILTNNVYSVDPSVFIWVYIQSAEGSSSQCNSLLYINPRIHPIRPPYIIIINLFIQQNIKYLHFPIFYVQMTLGGPGCRLQTCRCREAQWFDSTFWAMTFVKKLCSE